MCALGPCLPSSTHTGSEVISKHSAVQSAVGKGDKDLRVGCKPFQAPPAMATYITMIGLHSFSIELKPQASGTGARGPYG